MKNSLTYILFFAVTLINAQDCSRFYPFSEGTIAEITNYGKNGKVAAVTDYVVSNVTQNGANEVASINTKVKDKKGKLLLESSYNVTCTGNAVSIDVESMMNAEQFSQFEDATVTVTGTNVDLPNNLTAGQTLPDAEMNAAIDISGIKMNLDVTMTDRKVIGTESVTTPAGTFDCYVITYTSNIKMGIKRVGSSKQWLAEGVGLVKQEDYNKKGKVTSSSVLTAFSR